MANVYKNNSYAFALYACGDRYTAYRNNLAKALARYVPDADMVDIDLTKTGSVLSGLPDEQKATFSRLAIPLMSEFKQYDKVVWVDVDTDVSSGKFAGIFDVETSEDGLAAAEDVTQDKFLAYMKDRFPQYDKPKYFQCGVLVMDLRKIDKSQWKKKVKKGIKEHLKKPFRWVDQDLLNAYFSINPIDPRFNCLWVDEKSECASSWLVHYANAKGHEILDEIIEARNECGGTGSKWKDRCVVVSPRHRFVRSWIRSYFATGNYIPLVIIQGPECDFDDDDAIYCKSAAEYSGGMLVDFSHLRSKCAKSAMLGEVAKKLAPKSWAWIDDNVEISGQLDECFEYAERAPGFILAQFCPPEGTDPDCIDNRHPYDLSLMCGRTFPKICWSSMLFFHGDANARLSSDLTQDVPSDTDDAMLAYLYANNAAWQDGFMDFSVRRWQINCEKMPQEGYLEACGGKAAHYVSAAAKQEWSAKADSIHKAPFEERHMDDQNIEATTEDDPIDAVFVIGTGSINGNEELRYALRDIDKHCKFIRNVYICGYCPDWVDKTAVKHLQWPDRFQHAKDANIIDKLRHACECRGIAKRILFCSDDQFQTRECTWEDFKPRYLRRYTSMDSWYASRKRIWHDRLRQTMERDVVRRRNSGLDAGNVFYYQPHMWMQIDRDRFIDYAKWCGYDNRSDTIIAAGYFNFIDADGCPDFDHFFIGNNKVEVPDVTHIAYHDESYRAAMNMLKRLFPERCRFELEVRPAAPVQRVPETKRLVLPEQKAMQAKDDRYDPSPAKPEEAKDMQDVTSEVRSRPEWHGILGEISRAEEMRLFEVKGWRVVWRDIISRWRSADGGMKALGARSAEASEVVGKYLSNPDSMRTVRFGSRFNASTDTKEKYDGRALRESVWGSLRKKVQ